MTFSAADAQFEINGDPAVDGSGDRGYDASSAEVLVMTLETSPSGAIGATYDVFDLADPGSPLASLGAPLLTFVTSGTAKQLLDDPNDDATINLPATTNHSWLIRCTISTPEGPFFFERLVTIRGAVSGIRKTVPAESVQYEARAFSDELNRMVDVLEGGLPSGEANTASNLGAGVGVFKSKVGVDLQFRSLIGDGGIVVIPDNGTGIEIKGNALLPRDGSRVMTGDLDLATFDLDNVTRIIGAGTDGPLLRTEGSDSTPAVTLETTGGSGASSRTLVGNRDPVGNVDGNPGDYYRRVQGVSSDLYVHQGAAADNTSWRNLATESEIPVLIFRPGEPTPSNRVFADFNALFAKFQAIEGPVVIWFDDSITAPAPIPAKSGGGAYDFELRASFVSEFQTAVIATCQDDCEITGLQRIVGLELRSENTNQPVITAVAAQPMYLEEGASLSLGTAVATKPVIEVPTATTMSLLLERATIAEDLTNNNPVINLAGTAILVILAVDGSAVLDDTVDGDAGSSLTLVLNDAGVNLSATQSGMAGSITSILGAIAARLGYTPVTAADWSPVPDNAKSALDQAKSVVMRESGGPTNLTAGAVADGETLVRSGGTIVGSETGGLVRQTVLADIAVNTTTAAGSFPGSTLISQSVTITAGGILLVAFSCGTSNSSNNNTNFFRLVVDGVVRRAVGVRLPGGANSPGAGAMVFRVAGLTAGARLVDVQWYTTGGTAQIRPVAAPDQEHASLVVQEVTA